MSLQLGMRTQHNMGRGTRPEADTLTRSDSDEEMRADADRNPRELSIPRTSSRSGTWNKPDQNLLDPRALSSPRRDFRAEWIEAAAAGN